MKINLVRRGAWIGLAAIALLSSVPVLSASTAGAIELTRVGDSGTPFVRGPADIQWNWQAGTDVRFSTVMSLEVFNSAGARVLHRYRYVRYGQWPWDTRKVADGVYTARATVRNHPEISSVLTPIYVDNTAPTVEITSPARGAKSVYVQDVAYGFDKTVVVGATTVAADVADNFSGVGQVEWFLDGVKIELDDDKYDFSAVAPGEHTLSVIATSPATRTSSPRHPRSRSSRWVSAARRRRPSRRTWASSRTRTRSCPAGTRRPQTRARSFRAGTPQSRTRARSCPARTRRFRTRIPRRRLTPGHFSRFRHQRSSSTAFHSRETRLMRPGFVMSPARLGRPWRECFRSTRARAGSPPS